MKIDIFNHVLPPAFLDAMAPFVPAASMARYRNMPTMFDIDARLRMLDEFDDVSQIISLTLADPGLELIAGPKDAANLAHIGNDSMAAFCQAEPDRFPGFIATVAMHDGEQAVQEINRAVNELGAVGVQIHSNVAGKPLDLPEFYPVFERMAQLDKPVWLHPSRPRSFPDYITEEESRYDIYWALGWAYETSAAMARIVFSRMFDKLPNLKIICHHWGAYIPHAEGRMDPSWQNLGSRGDKRDSAVIGEMEKSLTEYFHMFYGDTAMFGARAASIAGFEFFGADHSVFASDAPFDPEGGALNIRRTIEVVDSLDMTDEERQTIYEGNAKKMLGLS